ncbi:MAG: endolytic transglycosylase MltG [Rikenellaceae bacterium]|jgi:UPF0755 protein|nr:endolytic transglycosylase MltG [Rikenellaceae bacterium]
MKLFSRRNIIIIVAVALVGSATASWQYLALARGAVDCDCTVYLPTGGDTQLIFDSLRSSGAVRRMADVRTAAALLSLDNIYHPGAYRLTRGMSAIRVVRMFKRGAQTPVRVTFNNIRSFEALAAALGRQLEPDSTDFIAALRCDAMPAHYGFTPATFMAMFIPDTYQLYWNSGVRGTLDRMYREHGRFWNDERLNRLTRTGLTEVQASTLASIVYEETKKQSEMSVVAGVYINRLRIGMPLQADPTVKFAVGDFTLRRILNRHLAVESPYNTYKVAGLPPGPICMAPVQAIDAVLNYKEHNYLYFCARPDFSGQHNFSRTLAEHNRNSAIYYRFLNSQGIR